jgi:hypothetical protein
MKSEFGGRDSLSRAPLVEEINVVAKIDRIDSPVEQIVRNRPGVLGVACPIPKARPRVLPQGRTVERERVGILQAIIEWVLSFLIVLLFIPALLRVYSDSEKETDQSVDF